MGSVILFDGFCGLCNRWVDFVLARDRHRRFRFASLQSDAGVSFLRRSGVAGESSETVILVQDGVVHTRSSAALRVFRGLGFPWNVLGVFLLVPRRLRDAVYDFVARHRYQWFGRRDSCRVPALGEEGRFLKGG